MYYTLRKPTVASTGTAHVMHGGKTAVVWLAGDMVNARLNEEWSAANAPRELQQQPADSVAFLFSMLQPEVMAKVEPLAKINLAMVPLFLSR